MSVEDSGHAPKRPSLIGARLNERYVVLEMIAKGGFSRIYKAQDVDDESAIFAVKVLASKLLDTRDDVRRRFENEARIVLNLRHHTLPTVHDFGYAPKSGSPFLVMDFLDGVDLKRHLRTQGALPASAALALIVDVLDGLQVGHQQGIIHSDLKPANLFLTSLGQIYILDFGLAKLATSADRVTALNALAGTPAYLAPEYISDSLVSPALDVYQMGLLLVEMVTGRKVVGRRDPIACLDAHLSGDLDVPIALHDSPLGPIIRRALELDPDARYPDASAMRDALFEVIDQFLPADDADWFDLWTRPQAPPPLQASRESVVIKAVRVDAENPDIGECATIDIGGQNLERVLQETLAAREISQRVKQRDETQTVRFAKPGPAQFEPRPPGTAAAALRSGEATPKIASRARRSPEAGVSKATGSQGLASSSSTPGAGRHSDGSPQHTPSSHDLWTRSGAARAQWSAPSKTTRRVVILLVAVALILGGIALVRILF